ncbi:MAG: IS3 family transposase [Candidatus Methylacidiphilales bacterium]
MAAKVVRALGCSGREVCRWLGFNRSTMGYMPKPVAGRKRMLEEAVVAMSLKYPTEGYKKIAGQLRALGYRINKKQVQRVRRQEGLTQITAVVYVAPEADWSRKILDGGVDGIKVIGK